MRLPPSEFRKVDLGVHAFLADVPLHDAWRIRLRGGGPGRTVSDVLDLFDRVNRAQLNPAVRALFALRASLGRLFGWDDPGHAAISRSYVGRLSEADRSRSLENVASREDSGSVPPVPRGPRMADHRHAAPPRGSAIPTSAIMSRVSMVGSRLKDCPRLRIAS